LSVEPLAVALENESSPTTIIALVWAIRDIHGSNRDKVNIDHLRRAVIAAGKHLEKVKQRPTGSALIDFLERFRYRDSVPCLIALLERFKNELSLGRADSLTLGLRKRANEVLRALTGAVFPEERPDEWREFWEREGHKIQVDKLAKDASAKKDADRGYTVTSFFGIPVRGRRVVFIIDVSRSMQWPMPQRGEGTGSNRRSGQIRKITKAKEELLKAVNGMPPANKFNVVFYAYEVERWQKSKKLVPASQSNKKSLASYLARKRADGGTNLFGGLKMGLEMKSLVYASRYDSNVDEIFILSDGVPTVGDVTNMNEILRLVAETNRYSGVRINAIYLGSKSDERVPGNRGRSEREGGEFMKKLAEQNGGRFAWPVNR
ncbi:MAG: VWA domain-containing protein, partial [Planctomycetota bacterium]